jgi:hypothetical protein
VAEPVGEDQRLGAGGAAVLLVQVDDRGDVEHAHARVDALVLAEVDAGDRLGGRAHDELVQRPGLTLDREHRPVMVRVG